MRPRSASRRRLVGILLSLALAVGACTSTDGAAPQEPEGLVVLTPFGAAEADRLATVLERWSADSGVPVQVVGTGTFTDDLLATVNAGDPPDMAVVPQPGLVQELAERNALRPLTPATVSELESSFDDHWVSFASVDGIPRGVFIDIAAKSLVWYRPDEFEQAGYEVPATWDELLLLSSAMHDDGRTPWCLGVASLGATGWPGTDWIEDLLLRRQPPGTYDFWVAGGVPFTDPRLVQAFEDFGAVALTPGWVRGGASASLTERWDEAGLPLLDDPAGCLMFKQASFWAAALPDDVTLGEGGDLDVFALPPVGEAGPAPMLVSGSTVVPMGQRDETDDLVTWLASRPGALALLEAGFISPNESFELAQGADPFVAEVAGLVRDAPVVRFDGSDLMPPIVGSGTFFEGIVLFLSGDDLADALTTIDAGWDEVRQNRSRNQSVQDREQDAGAATGATTDGTGGGTSPSER